MKTISSTQLLLLLLPLSLCRAKIPDAELYVSSDAGDATTLYRGSYGNFGSRKDFSNLRLKGVPEENPLLCREGIAGASTYRSNELLLTPRGNCSFELKLHIALTQYGAAGIAIYNNLESRYDWNETTQILTYPKVGDDYDCETYGKTVLSSVPFELDPPGYTGSEHDLYLTETSTSNVCFLDQECPSQRCLVTEKRGEGSFQACCAWDTHVAMTGDANLDGDTDDGVAIFLTMQQGDALLQNLDGTVRVLARAYPRFNASSFLLWILATAITAVASWYSAQDYRRAKYKLTHPEEEVEEVEMTSAPTVVAIPRDGMEQNNTTENIHTNNQLERVQEEEDEQSSNPQAEEEEHYDNPQDAEPSPAEPSTVDPIASVTEPPASVDSPPAPARTATRSRRTTTPANVVQSMELTMWHAVTFVVVASALLLLLFFFEFYTAVTVLYGIGCSGAMAQLIFRPLYGKVFQYASKNNLGEQLLCPKVIYCGCNEIALLDVLAGLSGYIIGAAWLYVWFTSNDPSSNFFYWITQDVMGACICILFLSILRLNSIKVATVLLIAVFLYDIFFVFLTPYIFGGESVMVAVATGGGPSDQVSADYCEKYPSNNDCKQGQPLPMLLTIPKINDFRGGANLLGLGDIVLPGLLTSFAARLDAAKRLVGGHTSLDVSPMPPKFGGYLLYLIIAYAVGLLFAMIAVVLMERGQPALLYLVPTTLGTMLVMGRKELGELWRGPKVLKWADRLVRYCDTHRFAVAPRFGDAATVAGSIEDEDNRLDDLELEEEGRVLETAHQSRYEEGIVMPNGSNRELT